MAITPIRNDNAYVGIGKQSVQGTPVAPSLFPRWIDGTKFEYDLKNVQVWEGDGTRRLSQLVKQVQMVKVTLVFYPRPVELGFFEAAAMGINSDTFVAANVSTTIAANSTVGASSVQVTASTGLSGTGTITLVLSPGTNNEEIATFTLPVTGAGPYTLTVANGGTLKKAHSAGDVIRSYSLHTITDQVDSPYYTIECGLGSLYGGAGPTIRVVDCKVDTITRSSKAGELLQYNIVFIGIASIVQSSPSTVVFENHNPFIYSQTYGNWTLNGSTTGDALAVENFSIEQKNALDTSVQTEQLTLSALTFGNIDVTVKATIVMQNYQLLALGYWGGATGISDSQIIGAGDLIVGFTQADGFHQVFYTIQTMHYDKITEPEPKKDGKHYTMALQASSVSNQSQNTYILQVALQNTQNSQY